MPVRMKHPMAIEAEARKIEARNGGSITKNRMKPATIATTLAIIAKTMLTVRSCVIAGPPVAGREMIRLTPGRIRVYAEGSSCTVA
jgi:hypothetical protein